MSTERKSKEEYKTEGLRRILIRKSKRKEKISKKIERRKKCTCGEDPYCYCGSRTPGVIDY